MKRLIPEKAVAVIGVGEDWTSTPTNNNIEGVVRGNGAGSSRVLGKLNGRRIRLKGHFLQLPNTKEGRALAILLTGRPAVKGERGRLIVDCRRIRGMGDLIGLLATIGETQAQPQARAETSEVLQRLLDFGIGRKEAARLAADLWVTMERVDAWIAYLERHAESFTNPRGMLVSRLRAHIEVPQDTCHTHPEAAGPEQAGSHPCMPALQALLDFGVGRKEAVQLAADPWVTTKRVEVWIAYIKHNRARVASPTGLLVDRLREHIEASPGRWYRLQNDQIPAQQTVIAEPSHQADPPSVHQDLDGRGTSPAAIWKTAYGELRLQMDQEAFDSWLRYSRLIDYRDVNGKPIYVVQVSSQRAQAWLAQRLKKVILRTLSQVAQRPVEVSFVVKA
ncbi:MAG: hypothetical protein JXB30_04965 [Anaerolineae bacterium]|nr:hypothetical protein [Anaerolineae bacterium]